MSSLQRNTSALRSAVNCLSHRSLPPPVARDHQTLSVTGKPHGSAPGVESYAPEWVWAANPRGRQHVHCTADAGLAVCRPAPVCCSCAQHRAHPRTGEVPVQEGGPPVRPPAAGFLSHSPFWLWMAHKAKATALLFFNVFNLFVQFITLCRPKAVLNQACQLHF